MYAATFVAEMKTASTTDSHLATKLAQRVAIAYLSPRTCSWAYKRGRWFLLGSSSDMSLSDEQAVVNTGTKENKSGKQSSEISDDESFTLTDDAQSDVE